MSETPGPPNPPPAATGPVPPPAGAESPAKPSKLYQATAWVVVIAGIVFIVSVIFFSGFTLGRHTHVSKHHRGHSSSLQPGGPQMGGPPPGAGQWLFVFPGGPGGPGGMGPGGMGPGGMGPGGMGPGGMGPGGMGPGAKSPSPSTESPPPPRP